MRHADVAVVVTNPEVSSVRDSDRIIGLLDSKTVKAERGERIEKHLLLTRYDPARAARGEMLKIEDVLEILVDPAARHHPGEPGGAARLQPRLAGDARTTPHSAPARAYIDAARRLLGEAIAMTVPTERKGFIEQAVRTEGGAMNLLASSRPQPLRAGRARAAADPAGA